MSIYAITYHLIEDSNSHNHCCESDAHDHHHHGRDDYEITNQIKTLGPWAHFMPTSFLVKTTLTAEEMLSSLKNCVEDKDMIFITKVDKDSVASLTPAVISWINKM